jgi:eukaryotic-like serine/threonine-protein kinase
MIEPTTASRPSVSDDPAFADLIEELTARFQRGEPVDEDACLRDHPDYADQLRQLLPALRLLADASRSGDSAAPVDGADPLAGCLGDFRILREVGRGGMGIVYEAEQISLGRRVALKVLPFAATMDPRHLQRFQNEARAAACLHHQNIVPVHGVGADRGVHYYAMQFIEGRTLAALIAEQRQDPKAELAQQPTQTFTATTPAADTVVRAKDTTVAAPRDAAYFRRVTEWGIQAAEALGHAHGLGIVHRDIKPANLMIDGQGKLWVTDFGLARVNTDSGLTMTGDLVGTLRYMSPEQALAKRVIVDQRTDIYSLGATLYELLTLQTAFDGADRQEVLRRIAFEEPRSPRKLNKSIPGELETIVLKALEKNPDDRYANAQDVAEDLRRFLDDRPIRAKRPSLRQRAGKWARRHKTVVNAAITVSLLTVVGLAVCSFVLASAYQWEADQRLLAEKAQEREAKQRGIAEDERDLAERRRYAAEMQLAKLTWEEGNTLLLQEILAAHQPKPGQTDLRGWEWYYLQGLCHKEKHTFREPQSVRALAFSPDGRQIACGAFDGVKVREVATGRQVFHKPMPLETYVDTMGWSPDGKRLFCASLGPAGTEVHAWDISTGHELLFVSDEGDMFKNPYRPSSFAWSPDGKWLAFTRTTPKEGAIVCDSTTRIWDLTALKLVRSIQVAGSCVFASAWSPDSCRLALAGTVQVPFRTSRGDLESFQDRITVWEATSGERLNSIDTALEADANAQPWTRVSSLAWSPDGERIALSGRSQRRPPHLAPVKVWKLATGAELLQLGKAEEMGGLTWSADGRFLAETLPPEVVVWDTASGKEVLTVTCRAGYRSMTKANLAFSPDGRGLACRGDYGSVTIWDLASGREAQKLRGHVLEINAVAWSPDGNALASADLSGRVNIWDVTPGQDQDTLTLHQPAGQPHAAEARMLLAWGPDRRRFASAFFSFGGGSLRGDSVYVWDAETGHPELRLPGFQHRLRAITWSAHSETLAVAYDIAPVAVWNSATGQPAEAAGLNLLPGPPPGGSIELLALSPDGKHLAAETHPDGLILLDLKSGQRRILAEPRTGLLSLAWRPDGHCLAYSTGYGLAVRDLAAERDVLTIPDCPANALAWSPDGMRLASAIWGIRPESSAMVFTIKIWDAGTGKELPVCRGHLDMIESLSWSPDGTRLASASKDGTVRLWDPAIGAQILTLWKAKGGVHSVAWSSDGKRLAAGGENGEIKIWNAPTEVPALPEQDGE